MVLTLRREVEQFIDEQVRAGRFPDAAAVIEAAISEFSDSCADLELTAEDVAAINKAESQAARGEGMELDDFRAKIAQRYGTR